MTPIMFRMNPIAALDRGLDQDLFESVTEEEIIYLWRSIKGRGLSEDQAWQAIVTGIALDMAFAKSRATPPRSNTDKILSDICR